MAANYTPLINSDNPKKIYNGYEIRLGETSAHFANRPSITKGTKKIVVLCIGASTPGQISTMIEAQGAALTDVKIINCCVGSEDINKWLNLDGNGWTNVESRLSASGFTHSDVKAIIMCHDDLRDQSHEFSSAASLANKMEQFIQLAKGQFNNLVQIDLMSRLCEYFVTDTKFTTPTGYHNGWAGRLLVDSAISSGGELSGVWVTDATGYLWTNGEVVRSDGFAFKKAWMKQGGTSIHLDTRGQGDDICASYIFNNMKRYSWFK